MKPIQKPHRVNPFLGHVEPPPPDTRTRVEKLHDEINDLATATFSEVKWKIDIPEDVVIEAKESISKIFAAKSQILNPKISRNLYGGIILSWLKKNKSAIILMLISKEKPLVGVRKIKSTLTTIDINSVKKTVLYDGDINAVAKMLRCFYRPPKIKITPLKKKRKRICAKKKIIQAP